MYRDSITHNFVYEGEEAEKFLHAIEESKKRPKESCTVKFRELRGKELKEFIERIKIANV